VQEFSSHMFSNTGFYKDSILQYIIEQVFDEQAINPEVRVMTVSLTKAEFKEFLVEIKGISPTADSTLNFIIIEQVKVYLDTESKAHHKLLQA
jgi:endonuclease III-like uncharacterized protein